MPFISRSNGTIYGLYSCQQHKGQEFLTDDSQEVIDFKIAKDSTGQNEKLIEAEIQKTQRAAAITKLKADGKLPADFVDSKKFD